MYVKVVIVIPARYASTRFPGKVLAYKTGKFLLQYTWEQACRSKKASQVIIAADDEKIVEACRSFGAQCVMTSEHHQSGTDRIAEAVINIQTDIVINLQADEPEIDPAHIDLLAELLENNPDSQMATLAAPFEHIQDVANPNMVKAIVDKKGRAIYFSRSPIPYDRDAAGIGASTAYLRHIGMYAYRKQFLKTFTSLPQSTLEKIEKLEQLRALENGYSIQVGTVSHVAEGIDTPEQYAAFVKRQNDKHK